MPIYEYRCSKCGQFEIVQKITEPALKRCPTCQSKVTKLMSSTSFQLKGSGWYVTDYARKGSADGKGKASDTKASDTKAETPASSSEKTEGKSTKPSETAAA